MTSADVPAASRTAFIGLGNMGSRMARRLAEAGYQVRGWDLDAVARAALKEHGGAEAESAADAVTGTDITILMLPDSGVVEQVLTDAAVLAALARGAVVVDMSSSEPERTRSMERALAGRGVRMVDAPVSGGVQRAESGQLAIMAGGDRADLGRVEPVLAVLGHVYHAGPIGAGHAVKALNNLMSATHLLVTSEAILAGQRFGLDTEVMLAIFNASSGRSGSTENKWPNFIVPEAYNSGFGLGLMLKDMRIATRLAEQMGSPAALGACAEQLWSEAAGELPAGADHTEIASWLRNRVTESD
ncbi:MAG: NAD(P)-dependent oxidoreductase [Solirubrobacterales bacterium]|nr:NAD(P)-dependent oxidoreductase [Solirubrobacterales bacterium]